MGGTYLGHTEEESQEGEGKQQGISDAMSGRNFKGSNTCGGGNKDGTIPGEHNRAH